MSIRYSANDFTLAALVYKHKSCEVCGKRHNEAKMVLCDRCEDAYHINCIGLGKVPAGIWVCMVCEVDNGKLRAESSRLIKEREATSSACCFRCQLSV